MEQPRWTFAPRHGGVEYLQDPSSGYFRDAPLPKLVRELLQNSMDSRQPEADGPVHVEFKQTEIRSSDIRGPELAKHVEACSKRITDDGSASPTTRQAYDDAGTILKKRTIPCLAAIDSNTTGLIDRKWNALVNQEGMVCKEGAGSPGGSNGIGKNAVFNVARAKTVFYATRFRTRKGKVQKTQGKAVLMSHKMANHDRQHIGFYQKQDRPLEGTEVPECFQLEDTGTGIFILGFRPQDETWADDVVLATVENFFAAIDTKSLTVTVQKKNGPATRIAHDTIEDIFSEHPRAAKSDSRHYRRALRNAKAEETTRLPGIGRLKVYADIDGGPRRTAYVNRNGMLITDSREQKTNPFTPRSKSLWPDYAVVVIPSQDDGDRWVRRMENPSHDSISADQLTDAKDSQQAKDTLKNSRDAIRKVVDEKAQTAKYGDTTNLAELAKHIPELNPGDAGNRALAVTTVAPPVAGQAPPIPEENKSTADGTDETGKGGVNDPDTTDDEDPTPVPRPPRARPGRLRFRNPRVIPESGSTTVLAFTPLETKRRMTIELRPAGGETDKNPSITVVRATELKPAKNGGTRTAKRELTIEHGRILINARQGRRLTIRVETEEPLENTALALG